MKGSDAIGLGKYDRVKMFYLIFLISFLGSESITIQMILKSTNHSCALCTCQMNMLFHLLLPSYKHGRGSYQILHCTLILISSDQLVNFTSMIDLSWI